MGSLFGGCGGEVGGGGSGWGGSIREGRKGRDIKMLGGTTGAFAVAVAVCREGDLA
jgi:hypothetical protein